MPSTTTYKFDTPTYKGESTLHTGLFINGQWVDPVEAATIDVYNPASGEKITSVSVGSSRDVDIAVEAAREAYKTVWGLKTPGAARGRILCKLASLIKQHGDELAALESLNNGGGYMFLKTFAIENVVSILEYFAGWADKVHGNTMETDETKFAYSRREPYGVVAAIVPWNGPLLLTIAKLAPALATGNTLILKPSEITPLTALRLADLLNEAGVPPGVVNIVNGYGHTVGQAMAEHHGIDKISFTGSTLTGRKILKAAAESNLKNVSLELGGKSPAIVFDDADLEQTLKWVSMGIFANAGQMCVAGSRIFVQEGIYDQFLAKFTEVAKAIAAAAGDPFVLTTGHSPQVSQVQYDRVMSYIKAGKEAGAKVACGGERIGENGYFIQPTIFTDVTPDMKIAQEEIFGPVAAVFKFKTEEEVIEAANNTTYGLSCQIYTENSGRATRVAHAVEAGVVWVNCTLQLDLNMPSGGYKQSGIGREFGEQGLHEYTQVKGVHINLGLKL